MYVAGQCVEAAMAKLDGKADDRKALADVLHEVSLKDTPRGVVNFDKQATSSATSTAAASARARCSSTW